MNKDDFEELFQFLKSIPSIKESMASGMDKGLWWVKFQINIDHPLAWNVVQEMGYILNYLSLEERLPTVFKPVSPPPYLNGGPKEFLSWIIQVESRYFSPNEVRDWLKSHLPDPVQKTKSWKVQG
jgi:hypothetical protein